MSRVSFIHFPTIEEPISVHDYVHSVAPLVAHVANLERFQHLQTALSPLASCANSALSNLCGLVVPTKTDCMRTPVLEQMSRSLHAAAAVAADPR